MIFPKNNGHAASAASEYKILQFYVCIFLVWVGLVTVDLIVLMAELRCVFKIKENIAVLLHSRVTIGNVRAEVALTHFLESELV